MEKKQAKQSQKKAENGKTKQEGNKRKKGFAAVYGVGVRFCLGEKGGKEGNFVIRVMLKDLHGVLPGCGDGGDSGDGVFIIKRRGTNY